MTYESLIRLLVLNEITDSYIDAPIIWQRLNELCAASKGQISLQDVATALSQLVQMGSARAYLLSGSPGTPPVREVYAAPSYDDITSPNPEERLYFLATEKGMAERTIREDPELFDEEGYLKDNCVFPSH